MQQEEVINIPHPALVAALTKPGADILKSLTPEDCNKWHLSSCIPSEGGELFDAVKREVIYRKPVDRDNIIEELGDLEFYMEGIRKAYGITREETLRQNIIKLSSRYLALRYSDKAAQERADKKADRKTFAGVVKENCFRCKQPIIGADAYKLPNHPFAVFHPKCADETQEMENTGKADKQ